MSHSVSNSSFTEIPLGAKDSFCLLPLPGKWQIHPRTPRKSKCAPGNSGNPHSEPSPATNLILEQLSCCFRLQFPHLQVKKLHQIILQVIVRLPQKFVISHFQRNHCGGDSLAYSRKYITKAGFPPPPPLPEQQTFSGFC